MTNEGDGLEGDSNKKRVHSFMRKGTLPTVLAVLALTVLATVYYLLILGNGSNDSPPQTSVGVCSDESDDSLLKRAANQLDQSDPEKMAGLGSIAEEIMNTEDYKDDPNCLYPVISHFITIGDIEQAQSHLNELESVYNPDVGFSPHYKFQKTPQDLHSSIQHLRETHDEVQSDVFYVDPVITEEDS